MTGVLRMFAATHWTLSAKLAKLSKSQAGEGWRLLKQHYDDGGLSRATMERPALQRLLHDIDEGQVDVVVVYKADRLTRSLTDVKWMWW